MVLLVFYVYAKSQEEYAGGLFTLGSPISQKIKQGDISYSTGGYSPNIDLTMFYVGNHFLGWGGSINITILDIRNLPQRINTKNRRSFCGFYTGPTLGIPIFGDYGKLILNAQVGYTVTLLSPINDNLPWGGFSMKVSADIVLLKNFFIGVAYRPLDLLIGDEYVTSSYNNHVTTYTMQPSFEIRVGFIIIEDT